MYRCLAYTLTAIFKARARLIVENLCLRQQLVVLKRRQARPQLRDADRRFWILACQLFSGWSRSLIIVKPDTVVSWHRKGWKAYWRWRSRRPSRTGRRKIEPELRELIRRMARENPLWGARSLPLRYNAESRRSWHVLALRFVHVLSPDTCGVHTMERPPPVADNSWFSIAPRSGHVISSPFRPFGFKHCTCFLSFTKALVNSYMRGSRHIPIRRGWRNKWSKPAGYRGNHRVTWFTTVMAALALHSIAESHRLASDRSALQ